MRASVVVVGLVALLCGTLTEADASPEKAKKRKGTFAAYIEPDAPDDPPMPQLPPEPKPHWLSVVVLIDHSAGTVGEKLDGAKKVIKAVDWTTWGDDRIAVLAFDESVDYVLRPKCAGDPRIPKAANKLEPTSGSANLAGALAETRSYMEPAPNRKVIVLVTDGALVSDELDDAMRATHLANIEMFVVGMRDTDEGSLTYIEQGTHARGRFKLGSFPDQFDLAEAIEALHYLEPEPPDSKPASAGWTIGSARSASPPPP